MRNYFTTPIKTLGEARAFFERLHRDGLLFHPEDSTHDIVNVLGEGLFSSEEAIELDKRIAEILLVDADPCAFILNL